MADEQFELISWSVYNERQGVQIDDLTFEQAWKIIAADDPKLRQHWFIWHDGLTRWRSPSDFENATDHLRSVTSKPYTFPAVPSEEDRLRAEEEKRINVFDFNEGQVAIDLDTSSFKDNRKNQRFNQRYLVEIDIGGQLFTTHTADISLGGMRLEESVPPMVPATFNARLVQEGGQDLYLKCALVESHAATRDRIRFILTDAKTLILRTWILEHPTEDGNES